MQTNPLFLGLTRPARFFGLPLAHVVGLIFLSVIPFVLFDEPRFLALMALGYPPLW